MELRFFRTFIKCHRVVSPDSLVKITEKDKLIVEMLHSLLAGILGECKTLLDVEKLVSELQEFNEHNTCLMYNFELNGSYLLEYMDYLDQNLNDAPRYLVRSDAFLKERINILQKTIRCLRQVKIVCKRMRFVRYLYGAEINDYVDHEKLEGLETRIKFLAENVGQFCFAIWVNEEGDDLFDIENKSSYLLFLAVLVELEMKRIFLSELSASKFIQSRTFKEKKLPKGFLHNLNSLLVHLRTKSWRTFLVMLNEVSKKIGVLVGDILCVIQMLLGGSTIKAETIKIDLWTIQILEKIEDLKAQVAEYYKSLLEYYDNLPDYLKPCLLYMGMFPEDARILVSKLIWLWIAEGFIQITESAILMEEATEGYLMDLISSNLVMVSKRKYNGKIKYCQVHDVVLHFCLERSREEKFMLAVESSELHFQPSHWKVSRVTFCFSNELTKFASRGSKTRKPFHQYLRSLITTKSNRSEISYQNPFSQVTNLRLLKVLDLSSHIVHYLSSATLQPLIHLKYLAVTADKFHFHEKSHLLLLETLVVKWLCGCTWLPTNFWKMEKLRHVEITRAVSCWEEQISKESSKLENLRILREDSKSAKTRLNLESFMQLQILRLSVDKRLILSKLYLPSNLKKLILRVVITENTISLIAGLLSLEYLQLRDEKYYRYDEKLCLGHITFHRPKFLKLVSLDFTWWDASEESFPLLETLTIKRCDKLWSIPYSFADIQTLKQIKFIGCNNQPLVASAVRIKKEVQDIEGCNRIDVIIEVSRNKLLYAVFEYLCAYNVLPCDQKVMGSSRETASCRSVV
ncbi:hypothetical protein P3S67_001917 [Capsicum chacoense]